MTNVSMVEELPEFPARHTVLLAKGFYITTGSLLKDVSAVATADGVVVLNQLNALKYLANVAGSVLDKKTLGEELGHHVGFMYQMWNYGSEEISMEQLLMYGFLAILMRWENKKAGYSLGKPDSSVLEVLSGDAEQERSNWRKYVHGK